MKAIRSRWRSEFDGKMSRRHDCQQSVEAWQISPDFCIALTHELTMSSPAWGLRSLSGWCKLDVASCVLFLSLSRRLRFNVTIFVLGLPPSYLIKAHVVLTCVITIINHRTKSICSLSRARFFSTFSFRALISPDEKYKCMWVACALIICVNYEIHNKQTFFFLHRKLPTVVRGQFSVLSSLRSMIEEDVN